jgi:hypothetical protein
MTKAGNGGNGDSATQNGQASSADTMAPTHLRGGCPGQVGGASAAGDAGKVGFGGGSIYLISGGEIRLQSSINASGAGGGGGIKNSAGGSGGGSGGTIVLYAATITIPTAPAPALMANGGGGGGGAVQNTRGGDGSDPLLTSALQAAGGGGPNGGNGYAVINPMGVDGASASATGGGGGGGGGGGAGYIRSNKPLVGAVVSPMVDIVP